MYVSLQGSPTKNVRKNPGDDFTAQGHIPCFPPKKMVFRVISILVGGFNPSEKYGSKWESSPNRGEYEKYLKPPPHFFFANQLSESETREEKKMAWFQSGNLQQMGMKIRRLF